MKPRKSDVEPRRSKVELIEELRKGEEDPVKWN